MLHILCFLSSIFANSTIQGIIIQVVGGLILLFVSYIMGKRKSLNAIKRKDSIYNPLINELSTIYKTTYKSAIKLRFVTNIIENNYKYQIKNKLRKKILNLLEHIIEYNNITIESIARKIIIDSFIKEYSKIIITTNIDVNSNNLNSDEENYNVAEIILNNLNLVLNNNRLFNILSLDMDNDSSDYINELLLCIFSKTFNNTYLKENFNLSIDGWDRSVAEYMVVNINFNEKFNSNPDLKRKKELLNKIKSLTDDIIIDIKKIVKRIVRKYERKV